MGQIYIPVMNWFLLALSLVLVCSISSIYEIGNAYGNLFLFRPCNFVADCSFCFTLIFIVCCDVHMELPDKYLKVGRYKIEIPCPSSVLLFVNLSPDVTTA